MTDMGSRRTSEPGLQAAKTQQLYLWGVTAQRPWLKPPLGGAQPGRGLDGCRLEGRRAAELAGCAGSWLRAVHGHFCAFVHACRGDHFDVEKDQETGHPRERKRRGERNGGKTALKKSKQEI